MGINDLEGLPPQFEVRSEEQALKGAVKQFHGIVREQGQVMSAALSNNESLWNTNKALRASNALLRERIAELEGENAQMRHDLATYARPEVRALNELAAEVDGLRAANAALREEMVRQITPELDTDARKEKLAALVAQRVELEATGFVPAPVVEQDPNAPRNGQEPETPA